MYKRVCDPAMILEKKKSNQRGTPDPPQPNTRTHTTHTDTGRVTKPERKALRSPSPAFNPKAKGKGRAAPFPGTSSSFSPLFLLLFLNAV